MNGKILLTILISLCCLYSLSSVWADDSTHSSQLEESSISPWSLFKAGIARSSDVATQRMTLREPYEVQALAFSPDGQYLATTCFIDSTYSQKEVHVWDWRHKHLIQTFLLPKPSDDATVKQGLIWSPDGRFLAVTTSGSPQLNDVVIRVWNTQDWKIAKDIVKDIKDTNESAVSGSISIAFSADSRYLLRVVDQSWIVGDQLVAYDTQTWQKSWGMDLGTYFNPYSFFYPHSMALSQDRKLALLEGFRVISRGVSEPSTLVVNLVQRQVVNSFNYDTRYGISLAISADGQRFAIGSHNLDDSLGPVKVLEIRDLKTGQIITTESAIASKVVSLQYTSDGRYLIGSYLDNKIKIWDTKSMQLKQEIPAQGYITTSPDGHFLAGGGAGMISAGKVVIWELK